MTGAGAPAVTSDPVSKATVLTFPNATIVSKSIDVASAPVTQGYGVMQKNGKLTLGVTGALSLGLYIAGLAVTSGVANGSAEIITQGIVDPSIINLGAGLACAVGLDANGAPVRVTDAALASGLKYVGSCDTNGAIFVQPKNATVFDFVEWGGVGDGSTDNTPIWNAIMSACAPPLTVLGDPASWSAQAPIYFPGGKGGSRNNYFFNLAPGDSLKIWRSCTVYGDGMGIVQAPNAPSTLLSFPLGAGGFTIQAAFQHDATKEIFCAYTTIRDLSLVGPGAGGSTARVKRWAPSTHASVGDVWVSNYYDELANSGAYTGGVMARAWICTVAGTTGTTEPDWPVPLPPLTTTAQTDGGVTWKAIDANGLFIQTGICKILRCRFAGFAGNGIFAVGSTSWGVGWQASGCSIEDNETINNGGNGIVAGGFDGSAMVFKNNTSRDNYGWNVRDLSAIGNVHLGGHVSGNGAGGWWGNTSTFVQPYSESGQPNVFTAKAKVIGGVFQKSGTYTPTRQNSHGYLVGDLIVPVAASPFVFYCLTAGTSAGSEPDFSTFNGSPMRIGVNSDDSFRRIVDGTSEWWCYDLQVVSDGLILGSQTGSPGVQPMVVQNPTGPKQVQLGLGLASSVMGDTLSALTALTLQSSDDGNFSNRFYLALDPTENRFYWTYTTSANSRFMEFTRAGATPEGAAQISFPNGIWTGNRALDALASSYFGPNLFRLAGGIDAHGGHYLGDEATTRDGALTTDATLTVAHTFALPDDATNGALTEVNVKVLAKGIGAGSECAVFHIRGSWFRKASSVAQVAAPEVVYGEPTDATHCTSGATAWTAVLVLSGTDVLVKVTGAASTQIHWYATVESSEGTRT